jgi:hypothetical protein
MTISLNRSQKKIIFIFVCFILLSSCDAPENKHSNRYISPKHVSLAQKLRFEVAQKLADQFNMMLVGEGGSLYDSIRELSLAFDVKGPLTQEKLRFMLVSSVAEFLSAINANQEVRPYLNIFPFTPKEIEITIVVNDQQGKNIYDPFIGMAIAREGNLFYRIFDSNHIYQLKDFIVESYDDALKASQLQTLHVSGISENGISQNSISIEIVENSLTLVDGMFYGSELHSH